MLALCAQGVFVQGIYILGGKCPGDKCPGGKCLGVYVLGVSVFGVSVQGVYVQGGYVLKPQYVPKIITVASGVQQHMKSITHSSVSPESILSQSIHAALLIDV